MLDEHSDQFEFFISKIYLAASNLAEGKDSEGLAIAREAIAHIEREKGSADDYTRHYMFWVANVVAYMGDFNEALELHRYGLAARVSLFGETSFATLDSCFALALCLYKTGDLEEAR